MYILDRLQRIIDTSDSNDIDAILSTYLIHNMSDLSRITFQKCLNDTHVSKASIHRFYRRGGFSNFKELISALNDEFKTQDRCLENKDYLTLLNSYYETYTFDESEILFLVEKLANAKHVLFYGNYEEISALHYTQIYLRSVNIDVSSLFMWNIDVMYEKIKQLTKDDLFIIVNNTFKLKTLFHFSVINHYYLDLNKIKSLDFHKIHIGRRGDEVTYSDFHNIIIPSSHREIMIEGIKILDKKIYSELKRRS